MRVSNQFKYWFVYFCIKIFYMFFAIFVYSKLTTLGDTDRWMDRYIPEGLNVFGIITNSTAVMEFFGGLSSLVLGSILGNLPFVVLAFYGIYYSVSRLNLSNRQLFWILVLLSFPSFGIWSSVAGKEAIGVFCMGIIGGYLIDLLDGKRKKPRIIEILSFYLLIVFKKQYLVAIGSMIIFIILSQKLRLRAYGKLLLFMLYIFMSGSVLYTFRDIINELSFMMVPHFSIEAGSTRENTIWVEDYDVFFNAPYGMFIAFWGPTLGEILEKPIQSFVFVESFIIFSFFVYFLLKMYINTLKTFRFNVYIFSLLTIAIFWLLFVHYPFGVLNPGSALRYRTNIYGFLVVLIYYFNARYFNQRA